MENRFWSWEVHQEWVVGSIIESHLVLIFCLGKQYDVGNVMWIILKHAIVPQISFNGDVGIPGSDMDDDYMLGFLDIWKVGIAKEINSQLIVVFLTPPWLNVLKKLMSSASKLHLPWGLFWIYNHCCSHCTTLTLTWALFPLYGVYWVLLSCIQCLVWSL